MKRHCHTAGLVLAVLTYTSFSCQSSPLAQGTPYPTPFVVDKILSSLQISASAETLCPGEANYRSLPTDYWEGRWQLFRANPPMTSGAGIALTSLSDSINIGDNTYEASALKPVTGTIRYYYPATRQNSTPVPIRFLLLLDENQLTTRINGVFRPYLDVRMNPGDDGEVTFDVPALKTGIHDLVLLGLTEVDQEPDPYGAMAQLSLRFTLVAGDGGTLLPRPYRLLKADQSVPKRKSGEAGIDLDLSLDEKGPKGWNPPETSVPLPLGKPLDFFVYVGYESAENTSHPGAPLAEKEPFALILFVDYHQVPLAADNPVEYGIVALTTNYAHLPVQLFPPQVPGRHDILAARINYPGFPVCLLRIDQDNPRPYPEAVSLVRVGIKISQ